MKTVKFTDEQFENLHELVNHAIFREKIDCRLPNKPSPISGEPVWREFLLANDSTSPILKLFDLRNALNR